MLNLLGRGAKTCDGVTRREMLQAGALSLFAGLTLPRLLRAGGGKLPAGKARSVIMFNLLGGPSHQDMFDLKPSAPLEIRGKFKPIATSVTGIRICEHLPKTARLMHKACLIRTFTHSFNSHDPLPFMTGYTDDRFLDQAKPSDPPDIGAICQYLGRGKKGLPGAVCMPCYPGWGEAWKRRGPYGGFLGSQYDPLFTRCAPTFDRKPKVPYYDPVMPMGEPLLPSLDTLPDMTVSRLDGRRNLLSSVDSALSRVSSASVEKLDKVRQRAFDMLTSSRTRLAFDLSKEPPAMRERSGRHLTGSCLLVARRLVEAGTPFVSVHQEIFGGNGHSYDMHENNFGMLEGFNLPLLDQVYSALITDLEARGLLDSTLVVVMGEMGRSPRVNAKAGRDHWPQCGFSLWTGGGVNAGSVYGETDKHAAYPVSRPVSPGDLVATIYQALGIDPHTMVPGRDGRPIPIAHGGQVLRGVLA
jgi:hypothetical protein